MLGAIVGDVCGSIYEARSVKTKNFDLMPLGSRYTDDTVLSLAGARTILEGIGFPEAYRRTAALYPHAGYGGGFIQWLHHPHDPSVRTDSWGNGAGMRVPALGWVAGSETQALELAEKSLHPTHLHPQSLRGAQAITLGIWMARQGRSKEQIKDRLQNLTGWNLERKLDEIGQTYGFELSCDTSVPEAVIAFLESASFEDALRNAISLGGDADTQACMAGALAEAYYGGVPEDLAQFALDSLPVGLLEILHPFYRDWVKGNSLGLIEARVRETLKPWEQGFPLKTTRFPDLPDLLVIEAGPRGLNSSLKEVLKLQVSGWRQIVLEYPKRVSVAADEAKNLMTVQKSFQSRLGGLMIKNPPDVLLKSLKKIDTQKWIKIQNPKQSNVVQYRQLVEVVEADIQTGV